MLIHRHAVRCLYPFTFNQPHQPVVHRPPRLRLAAPEIGVRGVGTGQQVLLGEPLALLQRLQDLGLGQEYHGAFPPGAKSRVTALASIFSQLGGTPRAVADFSRTCGGRCAIPEPGRVRNSSCLGYSICPAAPNMQQAGPPASSPRRYPVRRSTPSSTRVRPKISALFLRHWLRKVTRRCTSPWRANVSLPMTSSRS